MAKTLFDNILSGIGNAAQGATNFLSQGFSPAVQKFQKQAAPFVSQQPLQQNANFANDLLHIGQGIASQGAQYFNPENVGTYNNPVQNFWTQTQAAQDLGKAQQFTQGVMPKLRVNWAEPAAQNVQQAFGGNTPLGQGAGFVAGLGAGIPESIVNTPSDLARAGTNIGNDVRTGQFKGTRAVGDIAGAGLPLLNIWTMGEGGSILKTLTKDTWKMAAVKGFLNGSGYGAAFGGLSGLEQNKDAANVGEQFHKSLSYAATGLLTGGVLGTILGPTGKFFFGGKQGEAARLSQHNLIPQQARSDAAKILGVAENATLADAQRAYMQAVNKYHPQFGGTDEGMAILSNAYEILTQNHAPLISHQNGQMSLMWSPEFGGTLQPKQIAEARRAMADNDNFLQKVHSFNAGETQLESPRINLEQPTAEDQALGMAQLKLPQETPGPQMSDLELSQLQLRESNPNLQYPDLESKQLHNLLRIQEGLQARLAPEVPTTSRETQGLIKMRDGLQEEIDQAQSVLVNKDLYDKRYPNMAKKTDIRTHIRDLKASIKQIDTQVKDIQVKLKSTNAEKNTRIKAQLDDLGQQIAKEQSRLKVKQAVTPEPEKPAILPTEPQAVPVTPAQPATAKIKPKRADGKLGDAPTFTGKSIVEYDPQGVLSDQERTLIQTLLSDTSKNYGTGREIRATHDARVSVAQRDIKKLFDAWKKELPDEQSRQRVSEALDNSLDPNTLSSLEKSIFDRTRILNQVTYDIAQQTRPDLQTIANYFPSFVQSYDKKSPYAKVALSTGGRHTQHREIRAFTPAEGGEVRLGRAQDLGLTPSSKLESIFEDANGVQYVARDATMREKETLGIRYEKDFAKAQARHFTDVLRAKENFGVTKALKGDQYASLRVNPGEALPIGYKKVSVQGLEQYGFHKDIAKGLNQMVPPERGEGLVNDLLYLYREAEKSVTMLAIMNPIDNFRNTTGQAMFAASRENPITGFPKWILNLREGFKVALQPDGDEFKYFKSLGSNILDELDENRYGEAQQGVVNKAVGGIQKTTDMVSSPAWRYDAVGKIAAYKTLISQGVDPKEAVHFVDLYIGDYRNINPGVEQTISQYGVTFYSWFKTMLQPWMNAHKYPKALAGGLMWSLGTIAAANAAYQQLTGNPDASIGVAGGTGKLTKDVFEQVPEMGSTFEDGRVPPILFSRLGKPIAKEVVQQVVNQDLLRGKSIVKEDQTSGEQALARLAHLSNLNPLVQQAKYGAEGKKSAPEAVLTAIGTSNTPHLAGFEAAPNLPWMNTEGAKPGTGMEMIHVREDAMKNLSSSQKAQFKMLSDLGAEGNSESFKTRNQLLISDPKLFESKAAIEKANAQANGRQPDPLYLLSAKEATNYFKYQNMSKDEKADYALNDPAVIEVDRQRDAYKQSSDYQGYQNDLSKSIKGFEKKPFVHNPVYDSFDNEQIAAFQKWKSIKGQEKTDWAANHPWVFDQNKVEVPYYQQLSQVAWQNRPKEQSLQSFKGEHPNASIQGVDETGNLVFKEDYTQSPFYNMLSSQQRATAALYTAYNGHNMVDEKRALLAQNPWLPTYWEAQSAWIEAHPFDDGEEAGGLGIQFSNGKGGAGGGGSSNYMKNYFQNQFLYGAMDLKPGNSQLKLPQAQRTKLRSTNINQSLYNGESRIPAAPKSQSPKLPKLGIPTVSSGQLKIASGKMPKIQL